MYRLYQFSSFLSLGVILKNFSGFWRVMERLLVAQFDPLHFDVRSEQVEFWGFE